MIGDGARVARARGALGVDVGADLVLLDVEGCYVHLDGIGRAVWALLQAPTTVEEVVARLCADYDVSEDACRSDVVTLLEDLDRRGLVDLG